MQKLVNSKIIKTQTVKLCSLMKTIPVIALMLIQMFGFSPRALFAANTLKNTDQVTYGDSTLAKQKGAAVLAESVYKVKPLDAGIQTLFKNLSAAQDDILEMTITTDIQNLIVNKNTDEYQKAFLEYKDQNGSIVKYELKVKPRGKYRRKVCDFPPLKLNFDKDDLLAQGLTGEYDKLKLVTHCTDGKSESKDNVLREYLTYKMYNSLTDNSFRVILTKIKYVDLHNSSKPITRYGFLIENKDEMASRINGQICDCHGLKPEYIATAQSNLTAMFQYMIGNEDWDASMLRNIKAVNLYSGPENVLVPYDFDFSGLVNARYAVPDPDLKHRSVLDRHFFGDFGTYGQYKVMRAYFIHKKTDLFDMVKRFKLLSLDSRYEITNYLESFYQSLEDSEQAKQIFFSKELSESTEVNNG